MLWYCTQAYNDEKTKAVYLISDGDAHGHGQLLRATRRWCRAHTDLNIDDLEEKSDEDDDESLEGSEQEGDEGGEEQEEEWQMAEKERGERLECYHGIVTELRKHVHVIDM